MKESIANINETKNVLFNKIHNIDKPLVRFIKEKKMERTQINKIRNEIGAVKTNTTETHRIIRDYYTTLKK